MNRQQPLQEFVDWWRVYGKGDEKGQAQIFLDRLFRAFGHLGVQEAGGVLEDRLKIKTDARNTTRFIDLVLPGRVLIEMKKQGEDLRKHYAQAFDYWLHLVPNRPKYVILCNFDEFWIYELDYQLDDPRDKLRLEDLPNRWGPLAFLQLKPAPPIFQTDLIAVTKEAAYNLSQLFNSLTVGRKIPRESAQRFVLQCMLALFAEDIGLLPKYTFTSVIEDCLNGANSHDLFMLLFITMNRDGTSYGRFAGVPYFNGGIFAKVEPIELTKLELVMLQEATHHNWAGVRPAIFGTIFEGSLEKPERHQIGAHYTNEADIQRIVQPVIVRPWRDRIEAAHTAAELRDLQRELSQYQVLDPACGSGNFLYIAYREMKRLEKSILERLTELGEVVDGTAGLVSARQFWGFDIKPFAVELAKVTLMIARKLAVDELGLHENPLPLDNLDANIRAADALFTDWPRFDACIGNPPYMGAKVLKTLHDVSYVNRVRETFADVPGNADYCVYWFRKAHDQMQPGSRAGLVGTNTIRQNYSRIGGLDHIVANGGHIYEAVSTMEWEGEAAISVSIACWSRGEPPYKPARLWLAREKFVDIPVINSALSVNSDVSRAQILIANKIPKHVFQGQIPGHKDFVLSSIQVEKFIKKAKTNQDVIFPFMIGRDLVAVPGARPSRYIIDFGKLDVIEAQNYQAVFEHLKEKILPVREVKAKEEDEQNQVVLQSNARGTINHTHKGYLQNWWKHSAGRLEMLGEIENMPRIIVCSRVTHRPIFEFISPAIRPDNTLQVFAFEDDYSFGILQSDSHWKWLVEKGSTLRGDFRYTPESVFDTFPWPQQPTPAQVKAVALAGRALHEYRRAAMSRNATMTLRKLYTTLETPGANPLRDLHTALDKAVLTAYGFDLAGDVLAQLLALNESVFARIGKGESVTAPGVPADYPDRAELVSVGCVQPREMLV